jgi:hypothetical protein
MSFKIGNPVQISKCPADPFGAGSAWQRFGARCYICRLFRRNVAFEDAIGSHACSLEASMRVTNGIPLGSPLALTYLSLPP